MKPPFITSHEWNLRHARYPAMDVVRVSIVRVVLFTGLVILAGVAIHQNWS